MLTKSHIRDDLHAWNIALENTCGDFRALINPEFPAFIGSLDHQREANLEVAMIRTNASRIIHRCANHERHDDRYCFLVMQRSGRMQMSAHGRRAFDMYPGDLMLMDSIAPCDLAPCGLVDLVSIHLKRDELKRLLPQGQRLFAKVPASNVSGQILHGMLKQLPATAQWPSESEGQTLHGVMTLLLAQAINPPSRPGSMTARTSTGYLRRCAERLIEQQLHNPLLTPALLAQRLGISVRRLYRLFDDTDSICRHIQHQRLLRSAEDLCSRHLQRESISRIAARWGFTDPAHFSRVFKKHFSCSPREYRACPPPPIH